MDHIWQLFDQQERQKPQNVTNISAIDAEPRYALDRCTEQMLLGANYLVAIEHFESLFVFFGSDLRIKNVIFQSSFVQVTSMSVTYMAFGGEIPEQDVFLKENQDGVKWPL